MLLLIMEQRVVVFGLLRPNNSGRTAKKLGKVGYTTRKNNQMLKKDTGVLKLLDF